MYDDDFNADDRIEPADDGDGANVLRRGAGAVNRSDQLDVLDEVQIANEHDVRSETADDELPADDSAVLRDFDADQINATKVAVASNPAAVTPAPGNLAHASSTGSELPAVSTERSQPCATALEAIKASPQITGADGGQMPGTASPNRIVEPAEFMFGPGTLAANIGAAQALLARTGRYFLRDGTLMTVTVSPDGSIQLREAERRQVAVELDSISRWFKTSRGGSVGIPPPANVCDALLRPLHAGGLSSLNALAYQPFFRADGTLVTTPGYDAASGIYAHFDPKLFPIPTHPTVAETKHALEVLSAILEDVAFADDGDRAATLGAILTAAVRPGLNAAPMFLVRAPQAGTGKTFLCELIALFATPAPVAVFDYPSSKEECGKTMLAALRTAPPVIFFDNASKGIVPYDSLCSSLTGEHHNGRRVGSSTTMPVSTRTLICATGNNIDVLGDMTRRTVTINLDTRSELPAAKAYRDPELLRHCRERRHELVTAALTLIQAWISAGRPDGGLPPIASFGQWSHLCRMPLVMQGQADPAASIFRAIEDDPLRNQVGRMLGVINDLFGDTPTPCADIVKHAHDVSLPRSRELLEVIQEALGSSRVNSLALSKWFREHENQLVGDLRLTRSDVKRNSVRWIVQKIDPA